MGDIRDIWEQRGLCRCKITRPSGVNCFHLVININDLNIDLISYPGQTNNKKSRKNITGGKERRNIGLTLNTHTHTQIAYFRCTSLGMKLQS